MPALLPKSTGFAKHQPSSNQRIGLEAGGVPSSLRFSSAHTVLLYSGFGFFSLLFSDSKTCPSEATYLLLADRPAGHVSVCAVVA